MEEDYENAAKYKKQITQLQGEQLTAERVTEEFIQKKPAVGMKQLFTMMADIDATFTESFAERNLPWK